MTWDRAKRAAAHRANKERQAAHDKLVAEHFAEFRRARMGYNAMARALNERGVATPGRYLEHSKTPGTWTATMAKRIHDRLYFRCEKTADLFAYARKEEA